MGASVALSLLQCARPLVSIEILDELYTHILHFGLNFQLTTKKLYFFISKVQRLSKVGIEPLSIVLECFEKESPRILPLYIEGKATNWQKRSVKVELRLSMQLGLHIKPLQISLINSSHYKKKFETLEIWSIKLRKQ